MATRLQEQVPDFLLRLAPNLRECRPEEHRIDYTFKSWERCFAQDHDFFEIYKRFGERISRGNVFDLGREAMVNPACVRRFAISVMLWGYGLDNRGATRTRDILAHPQAVERLLLGAELVRTGDLADACLFFRSNSRGYIKGFGWSFFTKYFYFVGVASGRSPMPLILDGIDRDKGAAGGMKQLADAGDIGAVRAMELWWSTNDLKSAKGYALYVALVNQWAYDLNCRPDAIEMALWKGLDR